MTIEQPREAVRVRGNPLLHLDVGHKGEQAAISREHDRWLHAFGASRDGAHIRAVRVCEEQLRGACARRQKRDLFAIRRPAGRVLALLAADQQSRRRRTVSGHNPDVRVALTRRRIGCRSHERDESSVR
jgi:hypothetical protein